MGVNRIANRWAIRKATVEAEKWAWLLAKVQAVAAVEQAAHWNAGDYGDHMLYERLYYDTQEIIDDLAERILALSPNADIGAHPQIERMNVCLREWEESFDPPIKLVQTAETALRKSITEVLQDPDLDLGMEAFLTGVLDRQNTSLYLIQQRLAKAT